MSKQQGSYGAENIQALEGFRGRSEEAGNVYRQHRCQGSSPPGLGGRRQLHR